MVIFSEDLPNPEDVRQMIARGNRQQGNFKGFLYTLGEVHESNAVGERCKQYIGEDFKDAALLLRVMIAFGD